MNIVSNFTALANPKIIVVCTEDGLAAVGVEIEPWMAILVWAQCPIPSARHVLPVAHNPQPHGALSLPVRRVEELPSSYRARQSPDPRAVQVLHLGAGLGVGPDARQVLEDTSGGGQRDQLDKERAR